MNLWVGRIYEAITGTAAPSAPAVRRAIGPGAPCEQLLRDWRTGKRLPDTSDLFRLLAAADRQTPGFSLENEATISAKWWKAARQNWAGKPEGAATLEGEEA